MAYRHFCKLAPALFLSCGIFEGPKQVVVQPQKPPIAFTIKGDVDQNCSPCHRPGGQYPGLVFDTAEKYLASNARARVSQGTMPPPTGPIRLGVDAKARLLAFSGEPQ